MLDTLRLCVHAATSDWFGKRVKEGTHSAFRLFLAIIIAQHHMFTGVYFAESRQTLLFSRYVVILEILERSQQFSKGVFGSFKTMTHSNANS